MEEFFRLGILTESACGVLAEEPTALSISTPWLGSIISEFTIFALVAVEIAVSFFIELSSRDWLNSDPAGTSKEVASGDFSGCML